MKKSFLFTVLFACILIACSNDNDSSEWMGDSLLPETYNPVQGEWIVRYKGLALVTDTIIYKFTDEHKWWISTKISEETLKPVYNTNYISYRINETQILANGYVINYWFNADEKRLYMNDETGSYTLAPFKENANF